MPPIASRKRSVDRHTGTLPVGTFPSTKYVHQTTSVHNPDGRLWDRRGRSMARRPLLTDEERRLLFGVPGDPDALARHYTFTRSDQDLVASRRGDTNRLGFAVQLALLSHPGMGLVQMEGGCPAACLHDISDAIADAIDAPGGRQAQARARDVRKRKQGCTAAVKKIA